MDPKKLAENGPELPTREAAERDRCAQISRMARSLAVPGELAEDLIREGATLEQARTRIIDKAGERPPIVEDGPDSVRFEGAAGRVRGANWFGPRVTSPEPRDDFRAAATDALLLRSGVQVEKPHPAARDVSARTIDLARTCLSRSGITVSGGTESLIKRAMTTDDFPLILQGALHKGTLRGYFEEPSSHRAWVRSQPVSDFRDQIRAILGSAPELDKVLEGGEYRDAALDEDSTSYRIAKYGKIVSLTWELLVNDDLNAFMRVQPSMGQAARRKEADTVYSLFEENAGAGPTMQDGVTLFHANHANVVSTGGSAFDAPMLGAARALLRKQTALGGGYLSLVPRYLIIPAEIETEADFVLAAASRHRTTALGTQTVEASTPGWISSLELVVEPRLSGDAAYLVASNSQIDTLELGLFEENLNGPSVDEDREFRRDVFRWRVRHVFGAKFLDWRGVVKLPLS